MIPRLILTTVVFALGQMWSNKVRALLTTLGIIIGVWAITTVIAALGGLQTYILGEFEKFGATRVQMWGQRPDELRSKVRWNDVKFTRADVQALRDHSTTLERVMINGYETVELRYEDKLKRGVRVVGIEPDWHEIEQRFVTDGRVFTQIDDDEQRQVCLVNDLAIDELNLANGGIGESIYLNNRRFVIVGVVETKELFAQLGADDARTEVFVPFSTIFRLDDWIWTDASAQMKSAEMAEEAKAEIKFILRKQRQLPADWPDTFDIFQATQIIDQFKGLAAGLTMAAGVLVGISLLVGGIGIMNIMLVSVSERTREIGLRKALGAQPSVILIQFLVEAVILCVAGGLVGLVLGQWTTLGLTFMPNFPLEEASIPAWAIVLAFGFSAGVGVVFGMWPAIKASRLNPIDALRSD